MARREDSSTPSAWPRLVRRPAGVAALLVLAVWLAARLFPATFGRHGLVDRPGALELHVTVFGWHGASVFAERHVTRFESASPAALDRVRTALRSHRPPKSTTGTGSRDGGWRRLAFPAPPLEPDWSGVVVSDQFVLPFYWPAVAALVWLLVSSVRTARRERRAALSGVRCERCGYDLRASTGRCPECGHATAAPGRHG